MQNIYSQSLIKNHQKDQIMLQKHKYVMINFGYIKFRGKYCNARRYDP